MRDTRTLSVYLIFSCIAALLLILLVVLTSPLTAPLLFVEKVGIGSVFILCCCVGISLTIKPNWIRRYFLKNKGKEKHMRPSTERSFKGHHSECSPFKNHTIQWMGMTLCAGCLGLSIGLCASIVGMILYILTDIQLTKTTSLFLVLLGLFILLVVYGENFYQGKSAMVHVGVNSLLPLSFLFITISVVRITGTVMYGLFSILLCFLWLDTRIHLSKWHHRRLCLHCSEPCKMFTGPA